MSIAPVGVQFPPAAAQKESIFDKAICIQISRGWPSLTRALSKQYINVQNADISRFHGTKDLFKSSILKRLINGEAKLDSSLDLLCLPFPLQRGIRLVAKSMFIEVDDRLIQHVKQRKEIIDEFACKEEGSDITVYDKVVLESKQYLGDAFNPADYPPLEVFLSQFRFEWNVVNFNPAEQLKEFKKEYYRRESEKLNRKWEEASEAAQQLLRASMAGMVNQLCDRLSSDEGGKRKKFRDTVLDPMNEFIRTFSARDISNDTELQTLVNQTQQLLSGVDPKTLRSNDALRESVESGFESIKSKLSELIVEAPSRSIRFED